MSTANGGGDYGTGHSSSTSSSSKSREMPPKQPERPKLNVKERVKNAKPFWKRGHTSGGLLPADNNDQSRSLTSQVRAQETGLPGLPPQLLLEYHPSGDDKLYPRDSEVDGNYTIETGREAQRYQDESMKRKTLTKALPDPPRTELMYINGRGADTSKATLHANEEVRTTQRPRLNDRQQTSESTKSTRKQVQTERPDSKGSVGHASNNYYGWANVPARKKPSGPRANEELRFGPTKTTGHLSPVRVESPTITRAGSPPVIGPASPPAARSPVLPKPANGDPTTRVVSTPPAYLPVVPAAYPKDDFNLATISSYLEEDGSDNGEKSEDDYDEGSQPSKEPAPNNATISDDEAISDAEPDERRILDSLYDRFCVRFPKLHDDGMDSLQRRVATWVAKEAQRQFLQESRHMERSVQEAAQQQDHFEAKLKDLEEEKQALKTAHRDEMELIRQNHEKALGTQRQEFVAETDRVALAHDQNVASIVQEHQEELEKTRKDLERQHDSVLSEKLQHAASKELNHRDALNREISAKRNEIAAKESTIKTNRKEYEDHLNNLNQSLARNQQEWQDYLEKVRGNHADELEGINQSHGEEISDLKDRIRTRDTTFESEKKQLQEVHGATLLANNEKHATDRSLLVEEHNSERKTLQETIKSLKSEVERVNLDWQTRNARELQDLERTLTDDKTTEIDRLKGIIDEMKKDHDLEMVRVEGEKKVAAKKYADEKSQWQKDLKAKEDEAVSKYKKTVQSLQSQVRHLNKALLTRDDEKYKATVFTPSGLPSKPDESIQDTFQEIRDMVDELSSMRWKSDQRVWTPQVFQSIGTKHSQRKLRKAILQDLIWYVEDSFSLVSSGFKSRLAIHANR